MAHRWRLAELVDWTLRIRPVETLGESRRVRWVPNERLVRYYTTLGLVDRPVEMRGRTAFYGTRHLLQLLAIKQMQVQGTSLRTIQERLTGLSDASLRGVAALPADWETQLGAAGTAPAGQPGDAPPVDGPAGDGADFWERTPARLGASTGPASAPPAPEEAPAGSDRTGPDDRAAGGGTVPSSWTGLELARGAMLLLERSSLEKLDPVQLRRALEPLIEYLKTRTPISGGR
ncbi:MAG: MerR family transcriptional regulator [Candidatus Riflebacteria bacterium]|nr:MerR family transcriptional regulator [Candidatus Riflebacteria bacterium]